MAHCTHIRPEPLAWNEASAELQGTSRAPIVIMPLTLETEKQTSAVVPDSEGSCTQNLVWQRLRQPKALLTFWQVTPQTLRLHASHDWAAQSFDLSRSGKVPGYQENVEMRLEK